jgi:hypothetical protein
MDIDWKTQAEKSEKYWKLRALITKFLKENSGVNDVELLGDSLANKIINDK